MGVDGLSYLTGICKDDPSRKLSVPEDDTLAANIPVYADPRHVNIADFRHAASSGIPDEVLEKLGSIWTLPLRTANKDIGLLLLGYRTSVESTDLKQPILSALADMVSNALQRIDVLETLEQQVRSRTRDLTALYDMAAVVNKSLKLDVILNEALAKITDTMRAKISTIHLLDESNNGLVTAAHDVVSPELMPVFDDFLIEAGIMERVLSTGPVVLQDLASNPQAPDAFQGEKQQVFIGVPLFARGQTLGVLGVSGDESQLYNTETIQLLSSIAEQIGGAVINARLYDQARYAAVLEERQRLARDLHDSVTQSLFSLMLLAKTGSMLVVENDDYEAGAYYMGRISDVAHQVLKEMRLMVYELRPDIFEREGLKGALQHRLDAVEGRAGIESALVMDDAVRLPPAVELNVYRITQEPLNNVLKHSSCTSVKVQIRLVEGWMELTVEDDGVGFDLGDAEKTGGLGLATIRERVDLLKGSMLIESIPGEGTVVKVRITLDNGALSEGIEWQNC